MRPHEKPNGTIGYKNGCRVERVGLAIVLPWFRAKSEKVTWLCGDKWQKYGDFAVVNGNGNTFVEAKCERHNPHGNFFLETWSNKARGVKGWLHGSKCAADVLAYYFIESDELYLLRLPELREYVNANRKRYTEREQKRNAQPNDTWGLLVPIRHVLPSAALHEVAIKPQRWRDANLAEFLANQERDEWVAEYEGLPTDSKAPERQAVGAR